MREHVWASESTRLLGPEERDMRTLPLSERREWLLEHAHPGAGVQVVQHVPTHGEALFREVAAHDQEDIVAKRLDAPYRAGRQPVWLKIKNRDYSRRGTWNGRATLPWPAPDAVPLN
jgi:ATP-dependent DNA ligase